MHDDPSRENIACNFHSFVFSHMDDLRRDIPWGSTAIVGVRFVLSKHSQSKISDDRREALAVLKEYVFQFDVAMGNIVFMQIRKPLG
jgi:hypothetical protein